MRKIDLPTQAALAHAARLLDPAKGAAYGAPAMRNA
jgi:hypothetical protein